MKYPITLFVLFLFCGTLSSQEIIEGDIPTDEVVYYCAPCGCSHDGQYFTTMGQCPSCNMSLRPALLGLERQAQPVRIPTVGIFLFNGADVMDVSGPLSVFEHAGFNIVTFAQTYGPVRIGMHLELKPDYTIENLPRVDILALPGGGMAESDPGNAAVRQFLQGRYDSTEVLFSICSGAFFLGEAGLLDGRRATTFAALIPALAQHYPEADVLNNVKYTDNGKIVTSSGLSSGIDAAFQVVAKFVGAGRAQDIANHMEYPWQREHEYARSQLADNYLLELRHLLAMFSTSYFYSQGDRNRWEYRYALTRQLDAGKIMEIIAGELEKSPDWETIERQPFSISGRSAHAVLGKGRVVITLREDPEKGTIAVVTAERLKKHHP